MKDITLDWETASRITCQTLREYRDYLKQELDEWRKDPKTIENPKGKWLHPDDVAMDTYRIEILGTIIQDFDHNENN